MLKSSTAVGDYANKIIYVGIDVHKKHYSVTCLCDGVVAKRATLKASAEELMAFLNKYFLGAKFKTAYEAGFSGFGLHRHLVQHGIENSVVHAASIEISARDRVKTDKRDSLKIATQLSSGRLKGIHVPSEEREAYRSITRLRETWVEERTRVGNQIKSLLAFHGLSQAEEEKRISKRWIEETAKIKCHAEISYSLQSYCEHWLSLRKKIKEIDERLEVQAQRDHGLESIYQSVPGIGNVHARELSNELGDMKQFKNEGGLFSFTGLTPSEYSSGDQITRGHISRQGRPRLRKILVQAAWVAIKRDSGLKKIFERIAKKAGVKRAIIGIARRLIGRIRACFITGCLYELGRA